MLYVPGTVWAAALSVNVLAPDPGAAMLAGAKLDVSPTGKPLVESATAELNPPLTVTLIAMVLLEP
jgi:hypothetical protein